MISVGRDNIVRMTAEEEFYVKNPAFSHLKDQLDDCRKQFNESGRKAGCHCRADTKILIPCITAFMQLLTDAQKDENLYETVNNFVRYVAKTDNISGTGVSVYFRDLSGGEELIRYEFHELRKS